MICKCTLFTVYCDCLQLKALGTIKINVKFQAHFMQLSLCFYVLFKGQSCSPWHRQGVTGNNISNQNMVLISDKRSGFQKMPAFIAMHKETKNKRLQILVMFSLNVENILLNNSCLKIVLTILREGGLGENQLL